MQLYIIGLRQIVLIIWKMSTPCYFKSFNCPLHFSELAHWPFFYFLPSFATKNINNCILKRTLEANCTTVVTKSRFKHIDICMLCAALSRWEQAFIWVGEHLAMAPHQTSALQPRPCSHGNYWSKPWNLHAQNRNYTEGWLIGSACDFGITVLMLSPWS